MLYIDLNTSSMSSIKQQHYMKNGIINSAFFSARDLIQILK